MRRPGEVLILSCYEQGHQPLAAASVLALLESEGYRPAALDLSVEPHDTRKYARARFFGISVPMHTALRIGVGAARKIRSARPDAHICFYGPYATLNAAHLFEQSADSVIGGEFEGPLLELVSALERRDRPEVPGVGTPLRPGPAHLGRLRRPTPSRSALPRLERYARLEHQGRSRLAAAVESTRGCLHLCRHCPIPPVYEGRLFAVPRETVLEDVRNVIADGARHITFADPDFLNAPTHARRIVTAMHRQFPELTFDVTTKVEHILRHSEMFPELSEQGCLFVVTAVESLSATVLDHLRKGHTREDVFHALEVLRDAGIAMRPSLLPFTPWAGLDDYHDLLDWIQRESLVHHIDPVQLSIRLLIPPGSLLETQPAMLPHLRGLDRRNFSHVWAHPDPAMDRLQGEVAAIVRTAADRSEDAAATFVRIRGAADRLAGRVRPVTVPPALTAGRPPRLTEPWFC